MAGYKELYINDIEELADVMVADIQEGHELVRTVVRYDEASALIKELLRYDEASVVCVNCESYDYGDYSCEYVVTLCDDYGVFCEATYDDDYGYYNLNDGTDAKTYVFEDCNQKSVADLPERLVTAVMYEDSCECDNCKECEKCATATSNVTVEEALASIDEARKNYIDTIIADIMKKIDDFNRLF